MTPLQPKTLDETVRWGATFLESVSDTAQLDSELLLGHLLSLSKVDLLLKNDQTISEDDFIEFSKCIERRKNHEPIAYIIGRKYFWEHEFIVDPAVLIPRPDTETLVEAAIAAGRKIIENGKDRISVLDLGTGSGCIGISVAGALRNHIEKLVLVDSSEKALSIAKLNAERIFDAETLRRTHFVCSDWFSNIEDNFDLILSNPPYLERGDARVYEGAKYEPKSALYSAEEGLRDVFTILGRAVPRLNPYGSLMIEFGAGQDQAIEKFMGQKLLLLAHSWLVDFAGIKRTIVVTKPA